MSCVVCECHSSAMQSFTMFFHCIDHTGEGGVAEAQHCRKQSVIVGCKVNENSLSGFGVGCFENNKMS